MSKLFSPGDIVRSGLCIGCGSCVGQANLPTVKMKFDTYGQLKPTGDSKWLRKKTETFSRTCPFSPLAKNEDQLGSEFFPEAERHDVSLGYLQTAYVGYAAEDNFRLDGSSGGMATWVATELLRKGLIDGVAHVIPIKDPVSEGRYFRYRIARTVDEIREGAKSRYYPIELSEVLQLIKEVPGRYAVVGIPCFIKAIQLLRDTDTLFRERIRFTLGLFCGHMKSARFIESFAWQMNVPINNVQRVDFRHKDPSRPANWYKAQLTLRDGGIVEKDWWHLEDGDWGAGFFMNAACNFCDDVVAETADISFGDAWVEPYSSDGKGTNVLVIRSDVAQDLVTSAINEGRLKLEAVDEEFVVQTQAAGFRQRREGLAYRLSWWRKGVRPIKRVEADSKKPTSRRKLIYRTRFYISAWSHRVFWLASKWKKPGVYTRWAHGSATVYAALAYSRGKLGEVIKKWGLK